jgi:hypothetical protein
MIQFTKPTNLNGTELRKELNDAGVTISDALYAVVDDGYGNLLLDIADTDEAKAQAIVAKHNGTTTVPDNSADKAALLAKLGITADEARLLLS